MTFLKAHTWTSLGFTMLVGVWSIQLTPLFEGFWHNAFENTWDQDIPLELSSLIKGDFGAAAVLISFGVILGQVNAF